MPEWPLFFDRLRAMGITAEQDKAVGRLPEALHEPAGRWLDRLGDEHEIPADLLEPVLRVAACSEFAGNAMLRHWDWLIGNIAVFDSDPLNVMAELDGARNLDADEIKVLLRCTRTRAMLRIAWREIHRLADLDDTLGELSGLADEMLRVATQCAERLLEPRYGTPRDGDGRKIPLVTLGMGKLGGRELNFSSDIDLVFLFTEEGQTDGARKVSAQEYFGRLTRQIIALIDEVTVEGFVFRIDTRLRPFGESGPPVVSFAALESYLLQHGRDWERYAYVKARVVGLKPGDAVVADLYENLVRPFVYRRYLDYGVFESLRDMHSMIAAEVKRRDLRDNIKLGPGGIREAEFIVQSLQLVRGGSDAALQQRELQKVLPALVGSRGLAAEEADRLLQAYRFLRRLENFIQAIRDQQTHDLPEGDADRARLCLAMGFEDWPSLLDDLERHRAAISAQFDAVAFRERSDDTPFRQRAQRAWDSDADETDWTDLLQSEGCAEAARVAKVLATFVPTTQQIDAVSRERLRRFVPELLAEVMATAKPADALRRTLGVVERILRRSAYIALLNENPSALTRLVDLCARSRYIAAQIARSPALLDELLDPRIFSGAVTKDDLVTELRHRVALEEQGDSEAEIHSIVQFQRATMFRVAVADFNGDLPIMKVSDALTWLAEAVLDEALRITWRDMTERHGVPCYVVDGETHEAGFGIVGYGKLGGLELSYGSDLDIVFLHDSRGSHCMTNGDKPLDNTRFFARLVRRLVLFLTTQTGSGELYEIDTRLRPDGSSGLLVSSTDAFERYQEDNAWTWEHQALLRARPVAGSGAIAAEFSRIRRDTLIERVKRESLRDDVIGMRRRMRKQLDRSNRERFDLKHGAGGIGDIEFLVQYLVLENAGNDPDVIYYSDNIRQLDALVDSGILEPTLGQRLQDCYRSYRLRLHHLALDEQGPLVGADEFGDQRQFVADAWSQWLD